MGYNAKSGRASRTSQWATRLKNSKDSVTLLFEMVHAQFSNTKPEHRRRVTKLELEGKAEVTACACPLSHMTRSLVDLGFKQPPVYLLVGCMYVCNVM